MEPMRKTRGRWDPLGLRFEVLSAHLAHLTPEATASVLRFFESQALLLRRRRDQLDKDRRQARAAERTVAKIPPSPATPHGRALLTAEAKRRRDLEVMRLAARGWQNPMIARRLGLHPSTVSKIVQRQLRSTRLSGLEGGS